MSLESVKAKRNRPDQRSNEAADKSASQVFPHLYLGAASDLADTKLEEQHITHILNATTTLEKPNTISVDNFMRVPVLDSMSVVILGFLNDCVDFIEQRRKLNQKVLVHCVAGISRSATIAIAYTMKYMGLNVHEAYEYVKKCRPQIAPNIAFMGQLLEYQKIINGDSPVAIQEERKTLISPQRILPPVVERKNALAKVSVPLKKDRTGLSLSLASGDLMRKRKRSSDALQSAHPHRSKRPTLLLLPSSTTTTTQTTKCGKMLSKSDPISPKETRDLFGKATRVIHSDTDQQPDNTQPIKFTRVRHTSAGEFNDSD